VLVAVFGSDVLVTSVSSGEPSVIVGGVHSRLVLVRLERKMNPAPRQATSPHIRSVDQVPWQRRPPVTSCQKWLIG